MKRLPLVEVWEKTKLGESVIVEFDSLAFPSIGAYSLLYWAMEKGYGVSVIDILDTLKVYSIHSKLLGLDQDVFSDINVVKLGGRIEVGNVIGRISVTEERAVERELTKLHSKFKKERTIIVILGLEKLLSLYSRRTIDVLSMINFLMDFVGEGWMKSFYFINIDMMESHEMPLFPMLEELATTVVRIKKEGPILKYSVCKALDLELDGTNMEVDIITAKKFARDKYSPEEIGLEKS